MSGESIAVRLSVSSTAAQVTASLEFTNLGGCRVPLLRNITCPNGQLDHDVFEIYCDGKRVPYAGRLVKRRAPTEGDFLWVEPGESVVQVVRLDEFYAFPVDGGEFTATYVAYNPGPAGDQIALLRSNSVTFRL